MSDEHIGAVTEWHRVPALLVIDSFAPQLRWQVLEKELTIARGYGFETTYWKSGKSGRARPSKAPGDCAPVPSYKKESMVLHQVDTGRQLPEMLNSHVTSCSSGGWALTQKCSSKIMINAFHWSEGLLVQSPPTPHPPSAPTRRSAAYLERAGRRY